MNKEFLDLRNQFKGQSKELPSTSFDRKPISEGTYVLKVLESEVRKVERKGEKVFVHHLCLEITEGEHEGRRFWPFAPTMNDVDGLTSVAQNLRRVLGDVVPGTTDEKGRFTVDFAGLIEEFEHLAADMIGQLVECRIQNQRERGDGRHLDNDGNWRQNCYLNNGLGADVSKTAKTTKTTTRKTTKTNMRVTKKKVAKKKKKKKVTKKRR